MRSAGKMGWDMTGPYPFVSSEVETRAPRLRSGRTGTVVADAHCPPMSGKNLPKQAILIVNAASRSGADAFEQARDKLAAAGVELLDAKAVKNPKSMGTAIKAAIKRAPMVIVGGGDGSLSSSIEHFMGSDTISALLPLGTPTLRPDIGIPLDLDGAIAVIPRRARTIDLGCHQRRSFLTPRRSASPQLPKRTVMRERSLGRLASDVGPLVVANSRVPLKSLTARASRCGRPRSALPTAASTAAWS